jgi:ornithine carbamoyltransferase
MRFRLAGLRQRRPVTWRALLQQRHVPLCLSEEAAELGQEVTIDLNVRLIALGHTQQPRAPGAQRRVGWEVAPVEEVPGDGGQLHARSIRGLTKRDFLTGGELGPFELSELLDLAARLKAGRGQREGAGDLAGCSIALVFEKPSTRTRISFEVGVAELGATPIVLRGDEMQLSRGESAGDTGRVLSRYLDAIVIRSGSHEAVAELAAGAEVPVVNALTPRHHPCQALADLLTLRERFGDLHGLRLAYVGDGNNVARSLAIACELADVELTVAAPPGYQLEEGHGVKLTEDPRLAVSGADAIYTDVWVSMGDEEEAERRRADLTPFRVDADLLGAAKDSAVVLHCLPAHPGEEITAEVLYGPRSAVWDQAENRLHTQKALLRTLLAD